MFNHKPKHRGARGGAQPQAPAQQTPAERRAEIMADIEARRAVARRRAQIRFDAEGLPRFVDASVAS